MITTSKTWEKKSKINKCRSSSSRPCSTLHCIWLQRDFNPHCVQKACLLTWKIPAIRQKRTEDKDRKKQPGKDFTNRLFFLQKVGFSSVDILFALSTTGNPGPADYKETEGISRKRLNLSYRLEPARGKALRREILVLQTIQYYTVGTHTIWSLCI